MYTLVGMHLVYHTSARSGNNLGSQFSLHHASVCPAICILSTTMETVLNNFVEGVKSHLCFWSAYRFK